MPSEDKRTYEDRFSKRYKIHRGGVDNIVNRVLCGTVDPVNSSTGNDIITCKKCLRLMKDEKIYKKNKRFKRGCGGILNINSNKARIWFQGGMARGSTEPGHIKVDLQVSEVDIREPIKAGQMCQLQLIIPDLKEVLVDEK